MSNNKEKREDDQSLIEALDITLRQVIAIVGPDDVSIQQMSAIRSALSGLCETTIMMMQAAMNLGT